MTPVRLFRSVFVSPLACHAAQCIIYLLYTSVAYFDHSAGAEAAVGESGATWTIRLHRGRTV